MIHDTKNFLELNKKKKDYIYNGLKVLKVKKKIEKFGFSIYTKNELSKLKKFKEFDIIQIPGNIFDQDNLLDNSINFLKKRKIEIHVRSIFLQGLIFLEFEKTKKITGVYSKRLEKFFKKFKTKKERIYHRLNFIKNHKNINKIIIGITSLNEFNEIIKYLKIKLKKNYSEFFIKNNKITKPYLWKKKLNNKFFINFFNIVLLSVSIDLSKLFIILISGFNGNSGFISMPTRLFFFSKYNFFFL